MMPTVLDLCCGRGGWADGFIAAGWNVIGIDIRHFKDYPSTLIVRDVSAHAAAIAQPTEGTIEP